MNRKNALIAAALVAAGFSLATAAHAQKASGGSADATITIDQAKAAAGSVTPGDTAGFPVSISQPGSYKLTSNLVVPAGVDAIHVYAEGVTIDLNGFNITGPGYCSGQGLGISCTAISTFGIQMMGTNLRRLAVHGGTVGGFGYCVYARENARLSDLSLHNCENGAIAFNGSRISGISVTMSAYAIVAYSALVESAQIERVRTGVYTNGSLLTRVHGSAMGYGIEFEYGTAAPKSMLRDSMLMATTPFLAGTVISTGNNICNGSFC